MFFLYFESEQIILFAKCFDDVVTLRILIQYQYLAEQLRIHVHYALHWLDL